MGLVASRLVPDSKSNNMIGKLKSRAESKIRILVTAHHDSGWDVRNRKITSITWRLNTVFLFIIAGALLLRVFRSPPIKWHFYWLALGAIFVPSIGWQLFINLRGRGSPGANDNASGLAVLLESARVISKEVSPSVEFWFVSFGAEQNGLAGSKEFVKNHPELEEDTFVLNLDMVGVGEPSVIEGSGSSESEKYRTHSVLNRMLELTCKKFGDNYKDIWLPFSGYDHLPFIQRKIPSTTLSAGEYRKDFTAWLSQSFSDLPVERVHGYPFTHLNGDSFDKIDRNSIQRSGRITLEFINRVKSGYD